MATLHYNQETVVLGMKLGMLRNDWILPRYSGIATYGQNMGRYAKILVYLIQNMPGHGHVKVWPGVARYGQNMAKLFLILSRSGHIYPVVHKDIVSMAKFLVLIPGYG